MTSKPTIGKPPAPAARHVYGPRAIGAVMPPITRPIFRKHGVALGQLLADWPALVGAAAAAATIPRRLATGTLTLACTGPVALELQHLAPRIIERINTHLGRPVVERLRFVQEAPPRAAAPAAKRAPADTPVAVEGVPDGPLRDALASLGGRLRTERA